MVVVKMTMTQYLLLSRARLVVVQVVVAPCLGRRRPSLWTVVAAVSRCRTRACLRAVLAPCQVHAAPGPACVHQMFVHGGAHYRGLRHHGLSDRSRDSVHTDLSPTAGRGTTQTSRRVQRPGPRRFRRGDMTCALQRCACLAMSRGWMRWKTWCGMALWLVTTHSPRCRFQTGCLPSGALRWCATSCRTTWLGVGMCRPSSWAWTRRS